MGKSWYGEWLAECVAEEKEWSLESIRAEINVTGDWTRENKGWPFAQHKRFYRKREQ